MYMLPLLTGVALIGAGALVRIIERVSCKEPRYGVLVQVLGVLSTIGGGFSVAARANFYC